MTASNLVIDSPDKPMIIAWIDWDNISTGPVWDITYPMMSRFLESNDKYYGLESDDK
jgi:hypothetical protein